MTGHRKKIYANTGHRQAFLLYETKGLEEAPRPAGRLRIPIGIQELSARFPEMPIGKALVEETLRRLEPVPAFAVILLRLDVFFSLRQDAGDDAAISLLLDAAVVVEGKTDVSILISSLEKSLKEFSSIILRRLKYPSASITKTTTFSDPERSILLDSNE